MASTFTQASSSQWKPGLAEPIATLRLSPDALMRDLELKFEEEQDDLDRFQVAYLRTRDGNDFALVRYLNSPAADTEIWTRVSSSEPAAQLQKALEALGLKRNDVSWTRSDISSLDARKPNTAFPRKKGRSSRPRTHKGSKRPLSKAGIAAHLSSSAGSTKRKALQFLNDLKTLAYKE